MGIDNPHTNTAHQGINSDDSEGDPRRVIREKKSQPKGNASSQMAVSSHNDRDGEGFISGVKLALALIAVILACFLMLLDTSIVGTAIPKITDEFQSIDDIGWYGSAYNLGSAALQPLTGKIYHHFRLKWSFLVYFAVFELGSLLCGAAQSSTMLIIGRAVAGAGASGIINGGITIVSASVPLQRRPSLIGMMMGISQLGNVMAPLIGGAFTSGYTWRWCFYINLPLGILVAIPITLIHIPEQVPKKPTTKTLSRMHHHLDLTGFILLAGATVELLLALQYGGNKFLWDSSQVIGLFVGAGITFIFWILWNFKRGDEGLLPFSMNRRQIVWASALNYSFLMSTLFGFSFYLPIYFQAIKGVSAIMSGVYLLPTILPQLIFAILSGILITRVGYVPPFAVCAAALTAVGSGLFSLFQPHTSTGRWVGYQILTGAGRGVGFQMPIVATQHLVSPQELSVAMAFLVWAQYMGPTIFLTLYNTIFTNSLRTQLAENAPEANATAILAAGATKFREEVNAADLSGVLIAYSNSLDHVFYLVTAAGCVAFFAAFGMGWKDIRKKENDRLRPPDKLAS